MGKIRYGILTGLALAFAAAMTWAQLPPPPAPPGGPPGLPAPFPRPQAQPAPQQQMPPAGSQPIPQQQVPPPGSQPVQPLPPQQGAQPGALPQEYAFRPDLSNPEYGMCLKMEKNWKALWNNYYQLYNQLRMMSPNDPRYAQMARYAYGVKARLDAAWQSFSSRCTYSPQR